MYFPVKNAQYLVKKCSRDIKIEYNINRDKTKTKCPKVAERLGYPGKEGGS